MMKSRVSGVTRQPGVQVYALVVETRSRSTLSTGKDFAASGIVMILLSCRRQPKQWLSYVASFLFFASVLQSPDVRVG